MVNMFSMGMMGGGMNSMNGVGQNNGVNVHQQLKQRYSVGYEDIGTRPYAQPYPMAIIPRRPEPQYKETAIARFLKKCFN